MASDIFNYNATHGGSFKKGDKGAMFSAGGDVKLVQNWSVSYQLQVQPIYECGSNRVYFSAPTPQGTAEIGRIVSGSLRNRYDNFTICKPNALTIVAREGGCDNTVGGAHTITLKSAVCSGVQWSGQAQNAYIEERVSYTFISAEV